MNTSLVNLTDICIYVCDFVCNKHTFEIYVIVFALYPLTHNVYYCNSPYGKATCSPHVNPVCFTWEHMCFTLKHIFSTFFLKMS